MNSSSLTGLVEAARDGDQAALSELLERCSPKLLGLIRVRLGSLRSRLESRDVLQNTLLKAAQGLGRFDGERAPTLMAWLARIAENEIRDQASFFRQQRRDARLEEPLDAQSDAHPGAGGLPQAALRASLQASVRSVSSELVLREDLDLLHRRIEELDPMQREVVVLRSFEELDYTQIGARLERSPDACRMLYARALAKLALAMRAANDDPGRADDRGNA